jgi:hypothetical protein
MGLLVLFLYVLLYLISLFSTVAPFLSYTITALTIRPRAPPLFSSLRPLLHHDYNSFSVFNLDTDCLSCMMLHDVAGRTLSFGLFVHLFPTSHLFPA